MLMSPEMSITGDDFIRLGLWEVGENRIQNYTNTHTYIVSYIKE